VILGRVTNTDAPANLRDLRGLRTDDGRIVRRGVLYRSEALRSRDVTGTDVAVWPPTTVIDLRAPEEYFAAHPLDVDGTVVHAVPLGTRLAPALAAAGHDRPGLAIAYRHLAEDAADEIARIVGIVARANGPVLVHCTAGKDRTGIVVAVLLRAVGVRREDVLADYLHTGANLPRLWAALTAAGVPTPRNTALLGVQAEALEGVLDEVDATDGGATGWLVEHGADPADVERLATRLLSAAYVPAG
jgi:rhodanese-related sulfurtransferase